VGDSRSIATDVASFTFFEARSINFAIVVYVVFVHVDPRRALKYGTSEGNMAKKAKKAKAKKKTAKKKKK
jgi:large-conductance mechanosensitive channel